MVALFAEAAAEELASARFGIPAVVTELDLRYLAQTGDGPGPVEVHGARRGARRADAGGALRPLERAADDAGLRPDGHHPG